MNAGIAAPASEDAVRARIAAILAEVLGRPSLQLELRTRAEDVPGWDSLAHLRLLSALEEAYGMVFGVDEIEAPADVGELSALVVRLARSGA